MNDLALRLQPHYSRFDVANRLLFTGHSHTAWPDVAEQGLADYYEASRTRVDDKWEVAFERIEVLRSYLRRWYDDPHGRYSLAASTHELLVKWLSALDLRAKPRLVTTDGEFHSLHRQLAALESRGIEVVRVPVRPIETLNDRLIHAMDTRTAAVLLSRVWFETARILPDPRAMNRACRERGIPLLLDDYHGTNVVPLSLRQYDLEDVHLLIGGYKYLQWGEGNCFLRYPADTPLRPVITGWFASFGTLKLPRSAEVLFDGGDSLFMGATFDSVSQFRAARVAEFFTGMGLTPEILRANYRRQVAHLMDRFRKTGADPEIIRLKEDVEAEHLGGFVAFEAPDAMGIGMRLKQRGMYVDTRGTTLRIGPAPYHTDAQLDAAIDELMRAVTG